MLHPFEVGLDVSEHHGGRGGQVQLVGRPHDVEPFLPPTFAFGDEPPDAIAEDFGSGPRQRVEAGFLEGAQDLEVGSLLQFGDVGDFGRSEGG